MQKGTLAIILTALILTLPPTTVEAAKKQTKKTEKTFDLNLADKDYVTDKEPNKALNFGFEEPSAGETNLVQQMKLKPEFRYVLEDDDYNSRNNEYDRQIKLKLNLDF